MTFPVGGRFVEVTPVVTVEEETSLRESAFSSGLASGLHAVSWALILPCYRCLDWLLAGLVSTSLERSQRRGHGRCLLQPLTVLCGSLLFLGLVVSTAPLALLGFALRAPLQASRRPFCYRRQTLSSSSSSAEEERRETDRGFELDEGKKKATFVFATANVCLLPDGLARFNNLGHTQRRAAAIGRQIAQAVVGRRHIPNVPNRQVPPLLVNGNHVQEDVTVEEVTGDVSPTFPADLDILCLQEVFDRRAAEKLAERLAPLFGHVLYDVGVYAGRSCCSSSSFKLLNSGLLLASRFPVLAARFHCFPNGRGMDALAAKGLLSAKVLVGRDRRRRKRAVGYISCVHLHAPPGDGWIRCEQLDMASEWIREFQADNGRADDEVVFDVLCGDLNFDNCSPRDGPEQRHGVFEEYRDPCRAGPGRERPWALGTLLEQPTLYEEETRTPESLRRTLENEGLRRRFVCPPVAAPGSPPPAYPEPGQPWVGRRIDYILYGRSAVSERCRTRVEGVTFVSQLAGLTDHIPLALRLTVLMDSHCTDG